MLFPLQCVSKKRIDVGINNVVVFFNNYFRMYFRIDGIVKFYPLMLLCDSLFMSVCINFFFFFMLVG
jgi:hypothetical protein